tara:strand:+ start:30668 stop:31144 length:477 start_codon:yes stop_codon:yes gene_type:complete
MNHTSVDIYKSFTKNTDYNIERSVFMSICNTFNELIFDYILDGKSFNMGSNLSTLEVRKIERDPRSPAIDWGESNKYKQELLDAGELLFDKETQTGTKWHIYFTDTYYCKYHWRKGRCKIKNKSAYRFDATRGKIGNKEKLIRLLKEDDLAYLKFKKN